MPLNHTLDEITKLQDRSFAILRKLSASDTRHGLSAEQKNLIAELSDVLACQNEFTAQLVVAMEQKALIRKRPDDGGPGVPSESENIGNTNAGPDADGNSG